jgi:hypothetical protein
MTLIVHSGIAAARVLPLDAAATCTEMQRTTYCIGTVSAVIIGLGYSKIKRLITFNDKHWKIRARFGMSHRRTGRKDIPVGSTIHFSITQFSLLKYLYYIIKFYEILSFSTLLLCNCLIYFSCV